VSDGRGEDPIKTNVARVARFLEARKAYAGRERIMAADGQELKASDLEALVAFVRSATPEIAAKSSHGSINSIPYNDTAWMSHDEVLVRRHTTPWLEVSNEQGSR
jgi:hypothetical protein